MISYYELLGMIKDGKAPNKIKAHLSSTPKIYIKDEDVQEYCIYVLDESETADDNYRYYLMESYMESMIFDETIEILDKEKKIEKIDIKYDDIKYNGDSFFREQILMYCDNLQYKINEIIDYLQSKGE